MSFVDKVDRMSLPYIKSMEAAAKMANNADLLMAMQKSDSENLTAPESGMGSLDGDLKVSLCFGDLRRLFVLGCKAREEPDPPVKTMPHKVANI